MTFEDRSDDIGQRESAAFAALDPHQLLSAVDKAGYQTDGRISALNSYENRVYQIGMEDGPARVVKFYRPGRWSDETLLEEHAFTEELLALDLPVIHAERSNDKVLHAHEDFRFAVYPLAGGRPPELDNPEQLETIGRAVARLHNAGELSSFKHRPSFDAMPLGKQSVEEVLEAGHVPSNLQSAYESITSELLSVVAQQLGAIEAQPMIRIHGNFHPGNILWGRDDTPHILDFDDCQNGWPVQDLWMFLSGDRQYGNARLADLLTGYSDFREFDSRQLELIEPLRTLRQISYAAWIGKRWQEPAFVRAFPYFGDARFWDTHVLALKEQRSALDEPPLRWD